MKAILICLCPSLFFTINLYASDITPDLNKLAPVSRSEMIAVVPDVSEVSLKEAFGHDLSILPLPLSNFLLAVSLEKVTSESLTFFEPVGIPHIVSKGDDYWLLRYVNGERDIATLLNLAILFSVTYKPYFVNNPSLDIDVMQQNLLLMLEDMGYWPASYLLAEQSLLETDIKLQTLHHYQERMIACAEVDFIPCQLRIGIAVSNTGDYKTASMILQSALQRYFSDKRYIMQDQETIIVALSVLTHENAVSFVTIEQSVFYKKTLISLTL